MSLVDHSDNSSSRRVRWLDWKTQRSRRAYFPTKRASLYIAEDFYRSEPREFGDGEGEMASEMACHWTVGEGEGEVALDGLKAGEFMRCGTA